MGLDLTLKGKSGKGARGKAVRRRTALIAYVRRGRKT